jgi:hypothetical protein
LKIWRKKGNNSKIGNHIFFNISGQLDLVVLIMFTPSDLEPN